MEALGDECFFFTVLIEIEKTFVIEYRRIKEKVTKMLTEGIVNLTERRTCIA